MAQASFTPVARPPPTAPPAPPKAPTPAAPGWSVDRVAVLVAAGLVVVAILFEFGLKIGPQVVPSVPGLLFAIVLAFYARPWVYLTAGILVAALPLMVLFLFGAVGGLADPTAGRSYASLMCLVGAIVLGLGGGIHGFIAARRGTLSPARDFFRTRGGVSAAVVVAMLVGAGFAGLASGAKVKDLLGSAGGYDFEADQTVEIVTKDFQFVPRDFTVPSGQIVEIRVVNEDTQPHTFTYERGGRLYDHVLPGDSTSGFLVKFDGPMEIKYWCIPHSAGAEATGEEMWGTLTVT